MNEIMKQQMMEKEMDFLIKLKDMAGRALLAYHVKHAKAGSGFDIAKAIKTLNRVLDAEADYLQQHPRDYMDIYGD